MSYSLDFRSDKALLLNILFAAGGRDNVVILWPQYFDAKASRMTGRKVPKKLAIKSPTIEELMEAARGSGLSGYIEPDKAYPRHAHKSCGRLVIEKSKSKTRIIKDIATKLKEIRSQASGSPDNSESS